MRVAFVHDWLDTWGGSEQVLAEMLAMFPQADLFTLVDFLPEPQRGPVAGRRIVTSFVQKLPWARKRFRNYLLLLPFAVEQFDLVAASAELLGQPFGQRRFPGARQSRKPQNKSFVRAHSSYFLLAAVP